MARILSFDEQPSLVQMKELARIFDGSVDYFVVPAQEDMSSVPSLIEEYGIEVVIVTGLEIDDINDLSIYDNKSSLMLLYWIKRNGESYFVDLRKVDMAALRL